jgi:hypothetical protein
MRSDSILNTGLTSASINKAQRAKEARKARQDAKLTKRAHLIPAAEIIVEELQKELSNTQIKLLSMIDAKTTDGEVKDIIVALNLYTDSIKRLKSRISNIMRVNGEDSND